MGVVIIRFRGPRDAAIAAVDALDQYGFCARLEATEDPHFSTVEASCGLAGETVPAKFQSESIQMARAAVRGIAVEFTGNGVSAGGSVEPILLDFKHNLPLLIAGASPSDRAPDVEELWELLRLAAVDRESFDEQTASLEDDVRDSAWEQFGPYIRQAETYFRAGLAMQGSGAALLYYYCFLNLAKAELVSWRPNEIIGQNIHHGLSARLSEDWTTWSAKVGKGVFSLLHEKRTGSAPGAGMSSISVTECFRRCLEVGMELIRVELGPEQACGGFAGVFTNGHQSWLRFLVQNYEVIRANEATRLAVLDFFDERSHPQLRNMNSDFALPSRYPSLPAQLLESDSSRTVKVGNSDGIVHSLYAPEWMEEAEVSLGGLLEPAAMGFDFILNTSLSSEEMILLPTSLARYVGLFVVSSVVRYRPGSADPAKRPMQSFFLDAFTRQAPPWLLASSAVHLVSSPVQYVDLARRV